MTKNYTEKLKIKKIMHVAILAFYVDVADMMSQKNFCEGVERNVWLIKLVMVNWPS